VIISPSFASKGGAPGVWKRILPFYDWSQSVQLEYDFDKGYRDDKTLVMHFMEVKHRPIAARRNQALNHAESHLRL